MSVMMIFHFSSRLVERVYQFHTRAKTGRSKELQEKAPEANVELNAEDAENYGIKDGDEVLIKSQRGAIQVPATISKIAKDQIFIPFYYGY
jgi:ferredoxin-nitrate reductase